MRTSGSLAVMALELDSVMILSLDVTDCGERVHRHNRAAAPGCSYSQEPPKCGLSARTAPILRKASSCARHAIDHSICECPSDSTGHRRPRRLRLRDRHHAIVGARKARTRRPSPMPWPPAKTRSRPRRRWQAGPILPVAKRPADDRPAAADPLQDPRGGAAAGKAQQYHATDARIGMAREHAGITSPPRLHPTRWITGASMVATKSASARALSASRPADRRIRSCAHRSPRSSSRRRCRPGRASRPWTSTTASRESKGAAAGISVFLARRNVPRGGGSMHYPASTGTAPHGTPAWRLTRWRNGSGDRIARQMARKALPAHCSRVARGRTDRAAARLRLFLLPGSGYYLLRPAARCDGTRRRTDQLQWLFSATFVVMLLLTPVFGAWSETLPPARFVAVIYPFRRQHPVCSSRCSSPIGRREVAVARVFFVWVSVTTSSLVSIFWSVTADCFSRPRKGDGCSASSPRRNCRNVRRPDACSGLAVPGRSR